MDKKKTANEKTVVKKNTEPKDQTAKLADLTTGFLKKKANYDRQHDAMSKRLESSQANVERLQVQIAKTEIQLNQLEVPSMKNELIAPLAKAIQKLMPEFKSYEVIGPIGEQQAITVSMFPADVTDEEKAKGLKAKSLTLITRTEEGIGLGVRDFNAVDESIKPGTVAYAAGLQFKVIPVTEDKTVNWLTGWLK